MSETQLQRIRKEVVSIIGEFADAYFTDGAIESIAAKYVKSDGHRYRPLLLMAAYKGLSKRKSVNHKVKDAVAAIECIHKASLIHDDIEDNDSFRGRQKTLHARYNVPTALNIGDFLAGTGYALFVKSAIGRKEKMRILVELCDTQRRLCVGQGSDLLLRENSSGITIDELLDIFRKKTSSIFFLTLFVGAVLSGKSTPSIISDLWRFADSLGVAYQIKDDLSDATGKNDETSILNVVTEVEAERIFQEHVDKTFNAVTKMDIPILKECVKNIFEEKSC